MTQLTADTRAQWSQLMLTDPHPDPLVRRAEYRAWARVATRDEILAHSTRQAAITMGAASAAFRGITAAAAVAAQAFREALDVDRTGFTLAPPAAEGVVPM